MSEALRVEIIDDIAIVTIDLPGEKVNILKSEVMTSLEGHLEQFKADASILKGLVIVSGKKNSFIAGADISIIERISSQAEAVDLAQRGQQVFAKLAALPFPTVAAIHGSCLGGGTELALACSYRIATDDPHTFLGLPETQLGIIPGFGGTLRLPQVVGIVEALRMITTGAKVFSKKALRNGLVDEVVPKEHLLAAAKHHVLNPQAKRHPSGGRLSAFLKLLEKTSVWRRLVFHKARQAAKRKTGDHYPAIFAAIEAVEYGVDHGMVQGLQNEARLLGEMAVTDVSKNLLHVFRLQEKFSHVDTTPSRDFSRIGVVGAGVMGGGIVTLITEHGMQARLINRSAKGIGLALGTLSKIIAKKKRKGIYSAGTVDWIKAQVTYDTEIRGMRTIDAIIEAVVERMDVKKSILAKIAEAVPDDTLLLSNTSSLSISELAEAVPDPTRVAGLHFFNPVDRMQLVEVIFGEKSSEETIQKTMALAKRFGKIPVLVKDSPGFLVNRLLMLYLNEAAHMLEAGVPIEKIDKALTDYGMPMGPFKLLDMVGLDIAAHVVEILHQGFGDRMKPSPLLPLMYNGGQLGRKSGKGFYLYGSKGDEIVDPEIYKILMLKKNEQDKTADDHIVDRLILPMINEAAYCLAEGVVKKPDEIDTAMIFGAGFPPYTGGLLRYADTEGIRIIVDKLEKLSASVGERFGPAELLSSMADSNKGFYSS